MSFEDKLRGEPVDIVQRIDDSKQHTLVYRFERYNNQLKYGAR